MTDKQIAASMADALASIAGMPVVDPELNLPVAHVISAYHEALQIARYAVKAYKRFTEQS